MKLLWQWSVAMLSIVADLKQLYERFSAYTHPNLRRFNMPWGIMIEYNLIPRFWSLWCRQRPGKLITALVGDTTMTSILASIPIINLNGKNELQVTLRQIDAQIKWMMMEYSTKSGKPNASDTWYLLKISSQIFVYGWFYFEKQMREIRVITIWITTNGIRQI